MISKIKKLVSIILSILMVVSVFAIVPITASAVDGTIASYLTFTGTEAFSIKTGNNKANWDGTIEYSTDAETWTTWNGKTINSSDSNVLYFRGIGNTKITGNRSSTYRWAIATTGTVACSGDIRTLLDYSDPESSVMATNCFSYLFYGCASLTAAPELPATTLANQCYYNMFNGCEGLTTAPALPATTLAAGCYYGMFYDCKALTAAPLLPATTLAEACYSYMFYNCVGITTAPELPATTLAQACYSFMFAGTGITTAPALPATELVDSCYNNMFYCCKSLTAAPELPATELADSCYYNMFFDCKSLTTAPELPAATMAKSCYYGMFNGCEGLTAAPALPATTLAETCYYNMFKGCINLTTAPALPVTELAKGCYANMFNGCKGLTSAPALPATTLAETCYYNMFNGCTGLTEAPQLPATTLANSCYYNMFNGCTGLTEAPQLPATTLADSCYYGMFKGCTGLTAAPALPLTELANSCYAYMFQDCTGLTTAPALPATTIATNCYANMFQDCTGLKTAPALPATTIAINCYNSMFRGCTALRTAPALPATTLANSCYYNMFYGCTGLTAPPALPATTLKSGCYQYMFSGCSSIRVSTEQTDEYDTPYRLPEEGQGTGLDSYMFGMFATTGGTFTGNPTINTTYYLNTSDINVSEVTLAPSEAQEIEKDAVVSFTATISPANATDLQIKWSVAGANTVKLYSDENCTTEIGADATETLTVYAKGVAGGTAQVVATANADPTKTATCDVKVNAPAPTPAKLILHVGENGKVVMNNGTFGNATDASNIADISAPINVADGYKIFIVDDHTANLVEGGSINIATGGEVSFYPSADNTGEITAIPDEGYICTGWYNGDTLYSSDAALSYQSISEDMTLTAKFAPKLFAGHTVTLGGDIGVNFYLDDEVLDTYAGTKTVKFTVDGKETTVAVPATATADGYKVTCNVVAAQMAHKITATLCVDDEAVATDEYSVQEYAEKVYANPGEYLPEDKADKADEFKALAAAMLHYGGEAQTVFADALIVKPDRADSNLDSAADYSAVTADAVAAKINGETSNLNAVAAHLGAKFYTSSLLYLSQNTLRLYFTQNDDSFDPALFDDVRSEYYYYVQKEDIPAAELDDQQSFTVGNGTFTYSALDYVKAVIGSSMTDAQKNLAKALFLYNQAANAYFDDPVPPQNVVDLSTLEGDKELQNGDVVTGTLSGNKKITIAPGATVTLKNATITSLANADNVDYAGITPLGNATILLVGTNTVKGGHEDYPGIYVPADHTLTINGTGSLNASSNGNSCGIGGGFYIGCGNIIINGGTVTATGGNNSAGIGSGFSACGNITITGGTVTAIGGEDAPGIGSGYYATCGNITINGGTVTAIGGKNAPGIGGGTEAICGNITITDTVTMVTATKGGDESDSIGAGKFSTCGDVTIAPGANVTQN